MSDSKARVVIHQTQLPTYVLAPPPRHAQIIDLGALGFNSEKLQRIVRR